jgi:hypothetical protein
LKRRRLRFLLQEIDLPVGVTAIGRSPECQVTIEDPLVSRRHAEIVLDESGAWVRDLASRNGIRVNGRAASGPTRLSDGDRIRIGTQELVFCEVDATAHAPTGKTTGFLRHCARCRLPYPEELAQCPSCGANEQLDESTMTGQLGSEAAQRAWSLQLLVEVLDKAVSVGRVADALRAHARASAAIDERIASGETLDGGLLSAASLASLRLTQLAADPGPAVWVLGLHTRTARMPSAEVVADLAGALLRHRDVLREPAEELLQACRAVGGDREVLQRLEQLVAAATLDPPGSADETAGHPVVKSAVVKSVS